MGIFCLKFFLTGILFSLIIGAALVRLNRSNLHSNFELMLYSLGLGPVFTALMLYYLLLLIPGQAHLFYVLGIFVVYGVICIFSIKGFQILGVQLKEWVKSSTTKWKGLDSKEKFKRAIYWTFLLLLLGSFLIFYVGNTLQTPLENHDALIYGNPGKMYYHKKEVTYSKVMKPAKNGFFFQGPQKPSFSLLLTREMMLNDKQTNQSPYFDMYFRCNSGYYGLLIIGLYFFWLYRKNKYLALLGLLVLFSGFRFFLMIVNYHLDAPRMFFLVVSWIWLAYTIKRKDGFSLFLLGVFSGSTAFTHLIGWVVAVLNTLPLGNINWLVIPLLIWFLVSKRTKKPERWQIALIFVWLMSALFIGFKGYDNFRYQPTLFPFSSAMVLFLLWQFLADKSKTVKILGFSFIALVCLFNVSLKSGSNWESCALYCLPY